MDYIFLYAGQGSQKEGMGKDFYEVCPEYRAVIDSLDITIKNKSIHQWMDEGSLKELSDTELTQPCMAAFGAGVTAVLRHRGITPKGAAGLSLGEYGALHAAGVMDAKTYVELTAFRGKHMAEASRVIDFSMTAVLGMEASVIEEVCKECSDTGYVRLVNYNCPDQYVIGGEEAAVRAAEEILKEKGGKRFVPLKVSGPFHTKFMQPAAEKLQAYLESITLGKPEILVAANATGDFITKEQDIKSLLTTQIQSSVYFEQDIRRFLEEGFTDFIEIGPGNALSSFVKKIARAMDIQVTVINIDKAGDIEKIPLRESQD